MHRRRRQYDRGAAVGFAMARLAPAARVPAEVIRRLIDGYAGAGS